ncbi:flippase [Bacillus mobilis]|uniref:flippase n=1 Tax=Bacillus mobilis TaxID=2026190 RepID=UPI0022DF3986|nr:flippase [Bacillus mobilis]
MYNKKLVTNFLSLLSVQGVNYLLPLITLPYLLRVLGPEKFGVVAFAQAFVQYFVLLTDYGFNLTATKAVSIHRDEKKKVSEIFSTIMLIKILLMVFSFIVLILIVFSIDKFKVDWEIYIFTFGIVIGNVMFPIWFFQGMENMKVVSVLNAISKIIFSLGLFICVTSAEEFYMVPLLTSMGYISVGFISLIVIKKQYNLDIIKPKKKDIYRELKEGWEIFVSTLSISLYTISNTFILGIFTNNTVTGYYASAEKLINALNGLINPISQTIFPHLSRIVNDSKAEALIFIKKVFKFNFCIFAIISVCIFVFSDYIIQIIFGTEYLESARVLKILAPLPLLISLSNILGVQTMINFGYKKAFSIILISSSFFNIALACILVPNYQHIGTAIGVLLSEIMVTGLMLIYLKKKKIVLWRR